MSTDNNLIHTQSHIRGEKEVTVRRKRGRPRGSVQNKALKEAMKRKFGKVITPQKFGKLVELVYDQAMGKEEAPCKISQKLIFEYGMIRPGNEVEHGPSDYGVQIVINDMNTKTIDGDIEDGVWEEEKEESTEA